MSPIMYSLYPNRLTGEKELYSARVITKKAVDLDGLADLIVGAGSTVARSDIKAVLDDTVRVSEKLLLMGNRVNFGGLVHIFPRIQGRFINKSDGFDKSRHELTGGATLGRRIRKVMREKGQVEKLPTVLPAPRVDEYFDSASGETNGVLTQGAIGYLRGALLKYNPANTDEGLFLRNRDDKTESRIDYVPTNNPNELIFMTPSGLTSGNYAFLVRARVNDSNILREGQMDETLTVS